MCYIFASYSLCFNSILFLLPLPNHKFSWIEKFFFFYRTMPELGNLSVAYIAIDCSRHSNSFIFESQFSVYKYYFQFSSSGVIDLRSEEICELFEQESTSEFNDCYRELKTGMMKLMVVLLLTQFAKKQIQWQYTTYQMVIL